MVKNKNSFTLFDHNKKIRCHVCDFENDIKLKIFQGILQMTDNICCRNCNMQIFYEIKIDYKIINSIDAVEDIEKYL
jgi:hypothetical protein